MINTTPQDRIVILGAGISSLTAAYVLLKKGIRPLILERSNVAGGLMRNVEHGDFIVDTGRKELYSRIGEVHALWTELLQDDYKEYTARVGVLYNNRLLELSSEFRGKARAMPAGLLLRCIMDYALSKLRYRQPANYEEYRYRLQGRLFTRIFAQHFHEKFYGRSWQTLPVPDDADIAKNPLRSVPDRVKDSGTESSTISALKPRHPDKGAGQIINTLVAEIRRLGGEIWYSAQVKSVQMSGHHIGAIQVQHEQEEKILHPETVISSLPLETLAILLFGPAVDPKSFTGSMNRGVILIYLFINEKSRFPHVWINVANPNSKLGRITSYGNFNGSMVPENKTCLCLEYFISGDDDLLSLSDAQLYAYALNDCREADLFNPERCEDYRVIRLAHANAAVSWTDYLHEPAKLHWYEKIRSIINLYNVNRAGTDRAAHAGIKAAEAILSANKEEFERLTDATRHKPWEDV